MNSDEFEWHDTKARSNLAKHNVDFETAKRVFTDVNAIEEIDTFSDPIEERLILTGMAGGTIVVVVYSHREGRIRIISARGATKHEQDDYYRANTA